MRLPYPLAGVEGDAADPCLQRQAEEILEAQHGGVVADALAESRMRRVGDSLSASHAGLPRECVYVLLSSEMPNAFSLPGRIYVTRGLWVRLSDDGHLAAALAHEMAHLVAGDSFKPRCRDAHEALAREIEADRRAVEYLSAAGYGWEEMAGVVELISDQVPAAWAQRRLEALEFRPNVADAGGHVAGRPR